MKLLYFRLKGYVGIFHGMGLQEIVIPFDQFQHRIILIQGDNGCGKSTIINALSTDIDCSECYRTDDIIGANGSRQLIEYPAEKEIHLVNDTGDIFRILIRSDVKSNGVRDVTKAYISKNGEELNPKGNVNLYKEIRDNLLDIDSNCMKLSMVSSEDRGLVDKTPAMRKDFLVNVIGNLEFFNDTYKNLTKKSSAYKSIINNVKSKIYNIGDENNLRASLIGVKSRLESFKSNRDRIIKTIANIEAKIEMIDPTNEIQDLYNSILNELNRVKTDLKRFDSKRQSILSRLKLEDQIDDIGKEIESLSNRISQIESSINSDSAKLSSFISRKDDTVERLENIRMQLLSLDSSDIREDIESVIDDARSKVKMYEDIINNSDQDQSLTKSELEIVKNIFGILEKNIKIFRDTYSESIIKEASSIVETKSIDSWLSLQDAVIKETEGTIKSQEESIGKLEKDILSLEEKINRRDIILNQRPKGCIDDSCPFINEAVELQKQDLDTSYEESVIDCEGVKNSIQSNKKILDKMKELRSAIIQFKDSIWNMVYMNFELISRLGSISKHIKSQSELIHMISIHYSFNEFHSIDEMISMVDLLNDYNKSKSELIQLEADYKIYCNNKKLKDTLCAAIEEYSDSIQKYENEIKSIGDQISFNQQLQDELIRRKLILNELFEADQSYKEAEQRKAKLSEKFLQTKDQILSVKNLVDELNKAKNELNEINNSISPLEEEINRINFSLANLTSYQMDLESYGKKYDTIEFLRKNCSPTSGIQTLFMSVYFNRTITLCNELLSYLFGGEIKLLKPVINGKEFSIPFIDSSNTIIKDISKGSTSQRCMIAMVLSFALCDQSSSVYNIIRLDEIDGGLDTTNRGMFVTVLNKLMDILAISQCIMISHNIELEDQSTSIIHLTKQGISFRM